MKNTSFIVWFLGEFFFELMLGILIAMISTPWIVFRFFAGIADPGMNDSGIYPDWDNGIQDEEDKAINQGHGAFAD